MNGLVLSREVKRGNTGKTVKLVQEWLCLRGYGIKVDGDFGPATEFAVKLFQGFEGLGSTGLVDKDTFEVMVKPMKNALRPIAADGKSLGQMVVELARQHLEQSPRELGGKNSGPWVRLYMNENEGEDYPWCAGFVSFILEKACDALAVSVPVISSFSCDEIARDAIAKGIFLRRPSVKDRNKITPGSFFLHKKEKNDWDHTGIVVKAGKEVFFSIEGNTNDVGDREGYELCRRIRGYRNMDFVLIESN